MQRNGNKANHYDKFHDQDAGFEVIFTGKRHRYKIQQRDAQVFQASAIFNAQINQVQRANPDANNPAIPKVFT